MSASARWGAATLRPGLLRGALENLGIELIGRSGKRACRCPFHDDRNASAFVSEDNVFYCSVCTPDGGWSAKTTCEQLGIPWESALGTLPLARTWTAPAPKARSFTSANAQLVWNRACACARDDEQVEPTRPTWAFLERRKLTEAFELGALGVLTPSAVLPPAVSKWPSTGHTLIAPLFDATGALVNVQARSVSGSTPKTLFPSGSSATGTLFADQHGLDVLRGKPSKVLFGEGLTDYLALTIASPLAVLSAPGTSMAVSGVGAWARDCDVVLALDLDAAGANALQPVVDRLHRHGARSVRRIEWPGGAKDACDVVKALGTAFLSQWLRGVLS